MDVLPDVFPELSTHKVWKALRDAWKHDDYWFAVQELQFICAHCGPRIQIYEIIASDDGDPQFVRHSVLEAKFA